MTTPSRHRLSRAYFFGILIRSSTTGDGNVNIGGATTDVFSVFSGKFNRTVSANLGMSYSVCNVLAEVGYENILRWIPYEIDSKDLTNSIANKMIRPTTIPQTLQGLILEQAIAREALRLSFLQHKEFAVELKGVQKERTISDAFDQSESGKSLVNMNELDLIVGSGSTLRFRKTGTIEEMITASPDASVDLFYDGNKRFETTNTGAKVTGDFVATGNLNVLGTITYNASENIDSVGIITAQQGIQVNTLTAGRVPVVGAGKTLADYANFTYDGLHLGIGGNLTIADKLSLIHI